ncbi:MAG: diguanylate cyclase [Rhodospirillaceae bacterium]
MILIGDAEDENKLVAGLDLGVEDCIFHPAHNEGIIARVRIGIARSRFRRQFARLLQGRPAELIDPVTGAFSAAYAERHLASLSAWAARSRRPLSVVLLGLDFVGQASDPRGSSEAAAILKNVSQRVSANVRNFDLIASLDSGTILVAMADTDLAIAGSVADRIVCRRRRFDTPRPGASGRRPASGRLSVCGSIGTVAGGLKRTGGL